MIDAIGIKIVKDIPEDVPRATSAGDYCLFIGMARTNMRFYTKNEDISCPLARYNLGLQELDKNTKSALVSSLIGWGDAKTEEIALRFIESLSHLPVEEKCIIFFPYPDKEFEPDVIMDFSSISKLLGKVRRHTYLTGESLNCKMSGVGGLCGESTVYPILTKKSTISLGCTRPQTTEKLLHNQLILSIPFERKEYFFDD
jgi:uncharacterized protein (DUF169 family)